jgi:hypothetical protein
MNKELFKQLLFNFYNEVPQFFEENKTRKYLYDLIKNDQKDIVSIDIKGGIVDRFIPFDHPPMMKNLMPSQMLPPNRKVQKRMVDMMKPLENKLKDFSKNKEKGDKIYNVFIHKIEKLAGSDLIAELRAIVYEHENSLVTFGFYWLPNDEYDLKIAPAFSGSIACIDLNPGFGASEDSIEVGLSANLTSHMPKLPDNLAIGICWPVLYEGTDEEKEKFLDEIFKETESEIEVSNIMESLHEDLRKSMESGEGIDVEGLAKTTTDRLNQNFLNKMVVQLTNIITKEKDKFLEDMSKESEEKDKFLDIINKPIELYPEKHPLLKLKNVLEELKIYSTLKDEIKEKRPFILYRITNVGKSKTPVYYTGAMDSPDILETEQLQFAERYTSEEKAKEQNEKEKNIYLIGDTRVEKTLG